MDARGLKAAKRRPAFSAQSCRFFFVILAAFCALAADDQPPVRGRPEGFSGIIGAVKVQANAAPTEVQVESPLRYKLRLQGPAALEHLVVPNLDTVPAFKERFAIRLLGQDWSAQEKTREFTYELRPRSPSVTAIPPYPFAFYVPGSVPPERGYQTRATQAIPLKVTARPAAPIHTLPIEGLPDATPPGDLVFDFTDDVLAGPRIPWRFPVALVIAIAFLPPVLLFVRTLYGSRIHRKASAGCVQVQELASKLSAIELDAPDAQMAASRLLEGLTTLQVDRNAHSVHRPHCRCADFLKLCRAYRYGGERQDQLMALVSRAKELIARKGEG